MENFIIALILVVIFSVIYLIIYTYSHINNKRNSKQQQNKDKPYYCVADMKNKDSVDTKDLKNNDNNSNESISNESKNQSNYNYYKNKCCPVDPDIQNLIEQKISEIRSFISSQNFKIAVNTFLETGEIQGTFRQEALKQEHSITKNVKDSFKLSVKIMNAINAAPIQIGKETTRKYTMEEHKYYEYILYKMHFPKKNSLLDLLKYYFSKLFLRRNI